MHSHIPQYLSNQKGPSKKSVIRVINRIVHRTTNSLLIVIIKVIVRIDIKLDTSSETTIKCSWEGKNLNVYNMLKFV